jgi:hypothetical protein
MHGTFGFTFLDWALPAMGEAERVHLARAADRTIRAIRKQWAAVRTQRTDAYDEQVGDALGWMQSDDYLALASSSMETRVREPLLARGILVTA